MSIEFDAKISERDMYRFNLYHAYTGFQGIFATLIGIFAIIVGILTAGDVEITYTLLYLSLGVVFIIYMPVSLRLRTKRRLLMNESLKESLHYNMDEKGIHVSQNGQTADLQWDQVYKIIATKSNLLIYSSRVNAYIIPRDIVNEQYEDIKELADGKLERYRMKLK